MKDKQTYLFLVSLVVCLLSSCSSDAPDGDEISGGTELSFAVSGVTRSKVTTSFNEFTVYGDIKKRDDNSSAPVKMFDKTSVAYNGTDWSYDGVQYWFPNREHSFVAVCPSSVLGTSATPRYLNSQLSFTYTIPTTADGKLTENNDVVDIIAATHRRFYDKSENDFYVDGTSEQNKVTLKFGHLLSLINFNAAFSDDTFGEDEYLMIRKLELTGVKTNANITISPAAIQTNDQTDDVVVNLGADGARNLTVEFATPVKVINKKGAVSLFNDNNALIMIPQTFAADSEAKIIFSYTVNDDPAADIQQISSSLKNLEWGSNRRHNYSFTIEIKRAELKLQNSDITPWNNVGGADITVD